MTDNPKKILIIDDNTALRECLQEILMIEGFNVQSTNNGTHGIIKAFAFLPDLILCDIVIPGIDGYGVFLALRENETTSHIPFVFLTSQNVPSHVPREIGVRGDDYLLKPFSAKEALHVIRFQLEHAHYRSCNV